MKSSIREVYFRFEGDDWRAKHPDTPEVGDNVRIVYNQSTDEVILVEYIIVTEAGKYDKR